MGIFNSNQSLEEMEEKLDNCVPETAKVGAIYINHKLQKKLLESQNEANEKLIKETKNLTRATWFLVIATIIINLLILFKK